MKTNFLTEVFQIAIIPITFKKYILKIQFTIQTFRKIIEIIIFLPAVTPPWNPGPFPITLNWHQKVVFYVFLPAEKKH